MELTPGTIIDTMITESMTAEDIAELERRYNLDKPMIYRYGLYMLNLVRGDLGVSDFTQISVWNTYISRLPNTLLLSFSALIIGSLVAVPLGIFAAKRAGKLADNATTTFSLIGMSMPSFWLGLLLILLFSFVLGWLPAGGNRDGFRSLILPAICSGLILMATATRQTRSSMLEVLKSDYLRTARAKGVPEEAVIRKHALGNAWIPIVTTIGSSLSIQLAGAVVVEQVFAWPGIGRMAAEAVFARDVTTTTGVVILTSILYVLVQLIVDIIYAFIDPRIKAQYVSAGKRKKRVSAISGIIRQTDDQKQPTLAIGGESRELGSKPYAASEEPPSAKSAAIQASTVQQHLENTYKNVTTAETKKSFVTRADPSNVQDSAAIDNVEKSSGLVARRYRKRSRMGDIFYRIRKNKGAMAAFVILGLLFIAFIASLFISWDSVTAMNARARFAKPGTQFLFGADAFGRDLFLRVIYGTRYTLAIGLGSVTLAAFFGVVAGCFAGYYGRKADDIIMRCSDVLASIPGMLLGMVIMTMLGPSLRNLIIAVGVQAIPIYIRITRASILTVRSSEFVEAAKAVGLSNFRIIFTQVLPNGLSPIIVTITASLGLAIIVASSLSYLGFGVPVPHPEWGALIAEAREFGRIAPHLMMFPGLFIMIIVLAFNLLGDGLRDALDPKMKK